MSLSATTCFIASGASVALAGTAFSQSKDRLARWSFMAGMLTLAAESLFAGLCSGAGSSVDFVGWQVWRMVAMSTTISPWILFSMVYARGEARQTFNRWRWSLLAVFLIPIGFALLYKDDLIISIRPSEYGFLPSLGLSRAAIGIHLVSLTAAILVIMNLERTYRASIGTMRWRIKFMILGLGVIFGVRLLSSTHAVLFQEFNSRIDGVQAAASIIASIFVLRSLVRAGQFDIQLYPSQSVIKSSLTFAVAGAYLVIAGLTAKFVGKIGIGVNYPKKSLVILLAVVALTVALMSDRLRLLLSRFVSRNFQRPLYDYRSVWRQFTEATSSPSSQDELCRRLVRLMADVFQVQSASIWLYDEHEKTFALGASTAIGGVHAQIRQPKQEESAVLHRFLSSQHEPSSFETSDAEWAAILKHCHPAEFLKGGNRICAPLIFRGDPIGVLILGDRIGRQEFGTQDIDMFKCVADHCTAAFLNVQLSRQLIQARELQAFQTMATFFVHDLKNAASTLNLMLPNLKAYWDTPGFKEDALRGISKTVSHINNLVSRLGQLRSELTLQCTKTDLSLLLEEILKDLKPKQGVELAINLTPEARATLDPEQIRKVITNLVLNAYDATPAGGKVIVSTAVEGEWAVLKVTDTGCGMSPEFMNKSLFRPFQTTKKEGLGIGMFHSRMIIDAHGGRVKVESTVGHGTTFTVLLPVEN